MKIKKALKQFLIEKYELNKGSSILLSSIAINLTSFALPLMIMQVYDRILISNSTDTLHWLAIGVSVSMILETFLRYFRTSLIAIDGMAFEYALTHKMFHRLLNANHKKVSQESSIFYLDTFKSIKALKNTISGQSSQIIYDLPFLFLFLIILVILSWKVLVFFILASSLYFFIIFKQENLIKIRKKYVTKKENDRTNLFYKTLDRIHQIKTNTFEDQTLVGFSSLQSELMKKSSTLDLRNTVPSNIANTFSMFILFGSIGVASTQVMSFDLTVGALTACSLFATRSFGLVQQLVQYRLTKIDFEIAQERIKDFNELTTESSVICSLNQPVGILELSDLTIYDGTTKLEGLNLKLYKNQISAFICNDMDNSQLLLQTLITNKSYKSGSIKFDGLELRDISIFGPNNKIMFLPNNGVVFNGSVMDNITMFNSNNRNKANYVIETLKLDQYISELPQGYETQLNQLSNNLLPKETILWISLARIIVKCPRVLIIDNSQYNLSEASKIRFFDVLKQFSSYCNILWFTNEDIISNRCDNIFEITTNEIIRKEEIVYI